MPEPLEPLHAFGAASDEFLLFQGRISQVRDGVHVPSAEGRIRLLLRAGSSLRWEVAFDTADEAHWSFWRNVGGSSPVRLSFDLDGLEVVLPAHLSENGKGWVPGSSWPEQADLSMLRADWLNLPSLSDSTRLASVGASHAEWHGRWQIDLGPWSLTLDSRPDLLTVFEEARRERLSAITHHMELKRADLSTFNSDDGIQILDGLQFGLSFALGRWVAPALTMGYDKTGMTKWCDWRPRRADTAARGSQSWWNSARPEDLRAFLELFVLAWISGDQKGTLSFLVGSAIIAGESGFVEQRLGTSLAAIEHLSWVDEVEGRLTEEAKWRKKPSQWRVRRLLDRAHIERKIDGRLLPVLDGWARGHDCHDGAEAITAVRNEVMHPKTEIHSMPDGLVWETSMLTSRYLELLLLHRLRYLGQVRDRTQVTGWAYDSEPVPWIDHMTEDGDGAPLS